MKLYTLYIGHNNVTKKAFKQKQITKIINNYFDGYTLQRVVGYYKETKEDSFKVEIINDNDLKIDKLINDLNIKLKQESILKTSSLLGIEFIENKQLIK
jgi:hypothetical protein